VVRQCALSVMFNVICYARVWHKSHHSSCDQCYDISICWLVIASTIVLHLKGAKSFLKTSECTLRIQQSVSGEKYELRDVRRADIIQYWRRSGLKNPDKPNVFIKKNIRNHSYHQFYLVSVRSGLTKSGLTKVYCSTAYHIKLVLDEKAQTNPYNRHTT